jgi:hypothetical protein
MEIYPYDCTVCTGAYARCAYGGHAPNTYEGDPEDYVDELVPCEDGQFCWETECFIQVVEQIHILDGSTPVVLESIPVLKATYDGCGCFLVEDPLYSHYYFIEYDKEAKYTKNTFLVHATCASCYDPTLCKLCKDDSDKPSKLIRCDRH